jgi:hypothetical protein
MSAPCGHFAPGGGFGPAGMQYAALGYAVLPLARGGKRPHRMLPETGGVYHASRDADQIRGWHQADPQASIGVATGSVSQLCVIDLDVKNGQDGISALWAALAAWGVVLDTSSCVRTPSGGLHIWLRTPPGAVVKERPAILPGVDIKGDGGLVVVPPSVQLISAGEHDGQRGGQVPVPYRQAAGCPCSAPAAPAWVSQWLASAPAATPAGNGLAPAAAPDLDGLRATGIPRGERNATLYRLACSRMRARNMDVTAVLEDLRPVWEASDQSGLPWREVLVITDSARRFIETAGAAEIASAESFANRYKPEGNRR